ncbi:MAG: ankyrin repeat domain-containing protein [Bryobacteraceae bacterium]
MLSVEESMVRAIRGGRVEELRVLLGGDASRARTVMLDEQGVGRTLLHVATDWPGHFPRVAETIGVLIAAGAEVNARVRFADGREGETPLHWAASSDDVAALDALLDGGADIEATGAVFTGGTAMSDAVIFAQWKAARRLLERGAKTTLSQAAALGLVDRVRELVTRDAPPREEITKSLWHACRGGDIETVQFLVQCGGDAGWMGWDHLTPLAAAEKAGHTDVAAWLRGVKS